MGKRLSVLMVAVLIIGLVVLGSCGKDEESPASSEDEKAVTAQWGKFLKAIEKEDVEEFKGLCSSKIQDEYSQITYEDYLKKSKEDMELKASADYDITAFEFSKDMTNVEITLRNKSKMKFVNEEGIWLIKDPF